MVAQHSSKTFIASDLHPTRKLLEKKKRANQMSSKSEMSSKSKRECRGNDSGFYLQKQ